jgi:hypothetical protein
MRSKTPVILAGISALVATISATAAILAVFISFQIMQIHERSLLESIRPELMLTDWSRKTDGNSDVIYVRMIRNVGRGCAAPVIPQSSSWVGTSATQPPAIQPATSIFWRDVELLAPNESKEINGTIKMYWKYVKATTNGNQKMVLITIDLFYWDSTRTRYQVKYDLEIVEPPYLIRVLNDEVAPGVRVISRQTLPALRTNETITQIWGLARDNAIYFLFAGFVFGVTGTWFGIQRNRPLPGFCLGFFLGPFGWLLALLLPTNDGGRSRLLRPAISGPILIADWFLRIVERVLRDLSRRQREKHPKAMLVSARRHVRKAKQATRRWSKHPD